MKNMKTATKLIVSFGIVIALSIVIAFVGIIGMSRINAADDELYTYNVTAISQMGEIRDELQRQRNYTRDYALNAGDTEAIEDIRQSLIQSDQYMKEFMAAYEGTITDESVEADYFAAKALYENEYASIKTQIYEASLSSFEEAAEIIYSPDTASYLNTIVDTFTASMDDNNQWAKEQVDANTDLFLTMLIIEIIVLLVAVVSVVIMVGYISSLISKPLRALTAFMNKAGTTGHITLSPEETRAIEVFAQAKDETGQCIASTASFIRHITTISHELEQVAAGDLTTEVHVLSGEDVLGVSVKKMMDNLNNMFGEINVATSQVATGSKQIADGSQSLAQGSTEQAAAVEQLSSSIAEIAQKTKDNAAMADKAANLANTIKGNAETGSRQMDEMMVAVKDINDASQSINKVIKVIDDIAFQTNILALNAAVEAARAGQHGKGFAVVAEEVRNLAAKSAEAAKETGSMIANSIEKAELGARIANDTASSLVEIVSGINESTKLVSDIAKSSEEQSEGIAQINRGIDQVAQVIQQNSATAEESAAASEEMNGQSDMLQSLVAQFKLKDSGGNRVLAAATAGSGSNAPRRLVLPEKGTANAGEYGKY